MTIDFVELGERVGKATGADRRLEIDIWRALDGGEEAYAAGRTPLPWLNNYTESVDAALGLVERLLPGSEMTMLLNHAPRDWQTACIRVAPLKSVCGEEATLPLAIIAALLRALKSLSENTNELE